MPVRSRTGTRRTPHPEPAPESFSTVAVGKLLLSQPALTTMPSTLSNCPPPLLGPPLKKNCVTRLPPTRVALDASVACAASGTRPSVPALISCPVSDWDATLEPVTAPFARLAPFTADLASLGLVTACFLICFVPTLFFGNDV